VKNQEKEYGGNRSDLEWGSPANESLMNMFCRILGIKQYVLYDFLQVLD
jgi:hypothetical protein